MVNTEIKPTGQSARLQRLGLFFIFLACGLLMALVFSHFRPLFPRSIDIPARIALILAFLLSSLLLWRSKRLHNYWPVFFAFFIASFCQALDYYFSGWSLTLFGLDIKTPAGITMDKLESTVLIAVPIIFFTRLSGQSLGSIYLQKGNLRQGIIIGVTAFIAVAAISIPWAKWQYQTGELDLQRVIPWVPWVLIFVLANGINEELLFRGLFLRKLEPFIGAFPANLCMAISFTMLHVGVDYTQNGLVLLAFLLPLGLALGAVMQKTNGILGSWLIHASVDIAVVLSLFSQL